MRSQRGHIQLTINVSVSTDGALFGQRIGYRHPCTRQRQQKAATRLWGVSYVIQRAISDGFYWVYAIGPVNEHGLYSGRVRPKRIIRKVNKDNNTR